MSVEVDVEPLDCPHCRESNVPVMSMSCPHSYCLGCLQKLSASGSSRRQEEERERERRRCDGEREGETVEDSRERQEQQLAAGDHHKKRDDWLRCPVCDADGAFRVVNSHDSNSSSEAGAAAGGSGSSGGSSNHVNLKACELMGKAAALQMALFSERDRNQDVLRKCAAEYESVIVAMKSEALRNQKEILQLRESLDVKCRVIFHLQREVERLRADLWKAAAEAGEDDQQQQQRQQLSSAAAFQGKRKREEDELVRGDLGVVVGRHGCYDSTSIHSWEHQQQQERDEVLLPTDAVFRHKRQRENGSFSSSISGVSSFVKVPAITTTTTAKTTTNMLNDEGATKDAAASYGRFVAKVNGLQRQQANNNPSTTNSSAPVVDDDEDEDDDAARERKSLCEHHQQSPGQPDISSSSSSGKKKGLKVVKGRKKVSKFIPSDPETRQKNDEEKVENHVSNAADREICSVILASMAEKKTTTTTSESDDEVIKRNQDGDGDGDGQQVDCLDDDDAEDSEEERDPSSAREESVERKVTNDDGKRRDGVDATTGKKKKATESEDPARTKTSNTGHRPTPPSTSTPTSTSSVISADSSINDSSAKGNNKMTKKDDDERDDNDAAAKAEAAEASSSPSKAEDRGGAAAAAATATCRRGYIRVPGPHDVVLGRGGFANNHPGNVRFRQLVREHKKRYLSVTKGEKPNVSKRVVQIWRQQVPPGRFLARSDGDRNNKSIVGEWRDIGDAQARVKASQCLRERTEDAKMLLQQIEQERAAKRELTSKRSGGICFATTATAPQAAAAAATAAFPDMNLSDVTTQFNPMAAVARMAAAGNNNTAAGGGGGSSGSGSDVGMALGGSPLAHLPQHSGGGGGGGPLNGFPIRMPPAMFPSVIVEEQRQQQLGGGGGGSNDYLDADIKEAEYHRNMMLMHQERMQVQMQMRSMGDNLRVGLKQQQQHQQQLQHPTSFHGLGGTTARAFGSSTFELGGGGGVAAAAAAAAGGPMSVTTTVKGYFGPQGINSSTQLRMGVSNAYHVPPPPVASSPSPYDDGSP